MICEREKIAAFAVMYDGSWTKIAKALAEGTEPRSVTCSENYITAADPQYPACLRQLRYPPWILFYQGNIKLLEKPMMTIVGSRNMSETGKRMTDLVCNELKNRFVLVSGLARGVDACVHRHGITGAGTIGVIGSGLAWKYPRENRDLYRIMAADHLILSEYPFRTGVHRSHFPWRNRILAALGRALIVTQAMPHSGTSLTVNEALSLSRDVWCMPYPADDESGLGNNWLIRDGASILCSVQDIAKLNAMY